MREWGGGRMKSGASVKRVGLTPKALFKTVLTMSLLFFCIFGCNSSKATETAKPVTGTLSLIAGEIGGPGANDGVGGEARFASIILNNNKYGGGYHTGMATDVVGNIYLTDYSNHTIRKITPTGVVTTLAGIAHKPGSADGIGAVAQFNHPCGLTIDKAGNLYVSDEANNTIRKITSSGEVTTLAGTAGKEGSADGAGSAARFRRPKGIALSQAGVLYVVDNGNKVIRKLTQDGVVSTFAGTTLKQNFADRFGTGAQIIGLNGIAVDADDNVYITGFVEILKILPSGVVTTFVKMGEPNSVDIPRISPTAIAVDEKGYLYISSLANDIILKVDPFGKLTTLAGMDKIKGYEDGIRAAARFFAPSGITRDSAGNLYVADMGNTVVRKITPAGVVTTLAGKAKKNDYANGTGAAAQFYNLRDIVSDVTGNLYVIDFSNYVIRKITPSGVVSTLAGTPGKKGHADGKGSTALFSMLLAFAVDRAGNIYVVDGTTVRKVAPDGMVSTLAGKADTRGNKDGPNELARFNYPGGITVNGSGDVFVTDSGNRTIRKISKNGMVTTIVGQYSADHPLRSALGWRLVNFSSPGRIMVDKSGNLYVADSGAIKKINPNGEVSIFVGRADGINDGHGRAVGYGAMGSIDAVGNLYVTEADNHTIRRITSTGDVTTIAGISGAQGIVTGALPGGLDLPLGLARIGPNMFAIISGNAVLKLVIQ